MSQSHTPPMLQIQQLAVSYGGIRAVKGIDLEVAEGELVTLIGANGAGKTTTLKTIAGLLPLSGGTIHYLGKPIQHYPPHDLVRHGLALVPEGRGVFTRLSVLENLQMGAYPRRDPTGVAADLEHKLTMFPRLRERQHQLAGTLSGGEQQMLAIARALMSRPRLLLLDEPSMGLAPIIVQQIFGILRQIAAQGVTMLLVEQNARLALEVAQRGYVMESGTVTLTGPARELLDTPAVQAAYLGG